MHIIEFEYTKYRGFEVPIIPLQLKSQDTWSRSEKMLVVGIGFRDVSP
ncbi:MAG: hypothetical protein QME81_02820 [bacterium]|nr:hypothetical protein [bacterium]